MIWKDKKHVPNHQPDMGLYGLIIPHTEEMIADFLPVQLIRRILEFSWVICVAETSAAWKNIPRRLHIEP